LLLLLSGLLVALLIFLSDLQALLSKGLQALLSKGLQVLLKGIDAFLLFLSVIELPKELPNVFLRRREEFTKSQH